MKHLVVVALAVLAGPQTALAWGNEGHRITGDIAWHHLDARARKAVRGLMTEPGFRTLYDTATWLDRVGRSRPDYCWADAIHFAQARAGDQPYQPADCVYGGIYKLKKWRQRGLGAACEASKGRRPAGVDCIVDAIEHYARVLRDGSRPYGERVEALRFVAHLVGDIHQPLHLWHTDGRGGGRTRVHFRAQAGAGLYDRRTSLHSLWDTGFIRYTLARERQLSKGRAPRYAGTWRALSERWAREAATVRRAAADRWKAELRPARWADESIRVAWRRSRAIKDGAALRKAYYDRAWPAIRERLTQAGVRLAALLNLVFDRSKPLPF